MSYIEDLAEATGLSVEQCKLFARLLEEESGDLVPQRATISRRSNNGQAPLSFAQQRLWFLDRLGPGSPLYNVPVAIRLSGQIDLVALERSLNEIVRRHEVLRTKFSLIDGTPFQIISPPGPYKLLLIDLRHLPASGREASAQQFAQEEASAPFDLAQGPLWRATILQLADDDNVLLLTTHHIISDGWSMGILTRELGTLYTSLSAEQTSPLSSPLEDLPIQYGDYAVWQREWLQGEVLQRQLSYWKQQLSGLAALELSTDRPRPTPQTFRGAAESLTISQNLTEGLKRLGQQESLTLFMVLLAGFQALLCRFTGQSDIAIGSPIAGRNRPELEALIGFFINTLVLRTDLSGNPTFQELLGRVREVCLGAFSNQDVPFEKLVEELQPQRDLSRHPLFQVMLVLQNTPVETLEMPGLKQNLGGVGSGNATAKFDLTLSIVESGNQLLALLQYNTDLFDANSVKQMLSCFQTLLGGLASRPDARINDAPMLSEEERRQLLYAWNRTASPLQWELCAHQIFELRAAQQPSAIAAVDERERVSYAELNRRANQLGRYLRRLGVRPESRVALCVERGIQMVVGVLGTLKAGGCYVPLDSRHPIDRLEFMLADSQAPILITQEHLLDQLPLGRPQTVCLDSDWAAIALEEETNLPSEAQSENLAYLIYTSGSTGRPKAVELPHRGLANLAQAQQRVFELGPADRVLQFSSLSFDASTFELAMGLLSGAELHLAKQESLLPGGGLSELLSERGISRLVAPPSVLDAMPVTDLPELRTIILAGEALSEELVNRWSRPGRRIFNAYGPTETTIWATARECGEGEGKPMIGKPIENVRVYVLERSLEPAPVGVNGEIYIGGVGVGRGYSGNPGQTAESFLPDPYSSEAGSQMYRSGDVGRRRGDGELEYMGREDEQVKLRGYRIELEEIAAVLREEEGVRQCAVVVREDGPGGGRLTAYVVKQEGVEVNWGALREAASRRLPDYMRPSAYVEMAELPLSRSGKLDKRRLPAPEESRPELQPRFVPPRAKLEHEIAAIWRELLRLDEVGIDDNFFELGGHSLLIVKVHERLRDQSNKSLTILDLFRYPTIRSLSERLTAMEDAPLDIRQEESFAEKLNKGMQRLKRLSRQNRRERRPSGEAQ